jgi:type II secretory pathway component PulJ
MILQSIRCRARRIRAFSLLELSVAGALFGVIATALFLIQSGDQRGSILSSYYLNLMNSVCLAIHQLRTDLRQLTFVPGQKVEGYSIRISPEHDAILLRDSSPSTGSDSTVGSSFVIVEYRLEPIRSGADTYHLVRVEYTASGRTLPGKTSAIERKTFRGFTLRRATFLYTEVDETDERTLHVGFVVVSDTGIAPNWGPFREKELVLTNVLRIQRPEPSHWPAIGWSHFYPPDVSAEKPPGDVRAPLARHANELPDFGDDARDRPDRS